MKILFIQPTSDKRGHYGSWTSKLCQAIARGGDELWLATNKIEVEKYLSEPALFKIIEFKNGKYRFDHFDRIQQKKPLYYWYGYFRNTYLIVNQALKLCASEKFDAIFLTDVEYLIATFLLKRYRKQLPPIIWHVQAANFSYASYCGSRLKKLYKTFQRQIFKSVIGREVKGFAVLGQFHKEKLREQLQTDDSFQIEVIPDGADRIQNQVELMQARQKIGLDYAGTVFLYLGILRKDKGIEYLIEAISHLKEYEFKVILAGAPFDWTREEVIALVKQYDVASKVILKLDYIPDEEISNYYFATDSIVFPYTNEYTGGCGPLTKGAGSHGKPVIVTNVADIGRVVLENKNGFVASPCDASSLAMHMKDFLHLSKDEKASLNKNAINLGKRHEWSAVSEKMVSFFQKCAYQS